LTTATCSFRCLFWASWPESCQCWSLNISWESILSILNLVSSMLNLIHGLLTFSNISTPPSQTSSKRHHLSMIMITVYLLWAILIVINRTFKCYCVPHWISISLMKFKEICQHM